MFIRPYQPSDCRETAELFYNTIHAVNARDYSRKQLDAWAPDGMDLNQWNQSFQGRYCAVAAEGGTIVGFGDIDAAGYLDRLYVHKDYQGRGVATAILDRLELAVQGGIVSHVSITARPFFEKRGFQVVQEQQVERRGVLLTNFIMKKERSAHTHGREKTDREEARLCLIQKIPL